MSQRLKTISASSGFLENCDVEFSPQLTCIIGARGTCKSTLIESIRFAFDCDPERVAVLTRSPSEPHDSSAQSGLLRATLGPGTVSCEVETLRPDGESTASLERELDSSPRIYRDGVQEIDESGLFDRIEIYSQGEMQRVADDSRLRLQLIDRAHRARLRQLNDQLSIIRRDLQSIGPEFLQLRHAIASRQAPLNQLIAHRQQLSELETSKPQLPAALQKEREQYEWRQQIFNYASSQASRFVQVRKAVDSWVTEAAALTEAGEFFKKLGMEPESDAIYAVLASVTQLVQAARGFQQETGATLDSELDALRRRLEALNGTYYQLRKEEEHVNAYLKEKDALARQILMLEKLLSEKNALEKKQQDLLVKRGTLRSTMAAIGDEVFQLRLAEVDRINSAFGTQVVLTISQGTRTGDYQHRLEDLLSGSRLRDQSEIAADIAGRIAPSELIDIVETGDAGRLAAQLNRDASQMTRCVSYLADSEGLYGLEGLLLEDELDVQLYIEGAPHRVDELSKGQKATALLPLILRDADYPLLFDQPEDDLDNRFIYDSLVQTIRALKLKRQLVFVTHNANIPVLGEAEKVIVMQMESPRKARAPESGTVDEMRAHILQLLEGGEEAFRLRQQKYGIRNS